MEDFGDYECLAAVASGSTGSVWRARHRELDRVVAVKELSAALRDRPGFLEGFRTEARHLAALDDPHVVKVFDYVEEPHRAWMAEEWVDGVRLDVLLDATGRLTAEQALGVLRGVLLGLAAAHAMRLVHGDVAPSNILVDEDGTAKLVDFGLSATAGSATDLAVIGTPAYLSPETVLCRARDARSDVYSAAAVLVELLTGAPPYPGDTVASVLDRHVHAPVPDLPDVGPALARVIRSALAKDPDERPVDARAFLDELERVAAEEHGTGWLERSSVAGLAGTLIAGGLGGAMGGAMAGMTAGGLTAATGGATTTTAAAAVTGGTVTTGSASVSTSASTIGIAARSGSRKLLYLAGGGSAAGAVAVAAVVLLTGGSAPVTVAGRYAESGHIVTSEFTNNHPGQAIAAESWTFPSCHGRLPCSGTFAVEGGSNLPFSFDGHVLTSRFTETTSEPCGANGDAHERSDGVLNLQVGQRPSSGPVQVLNGTLDQTVTALSVPRGCFIGPPKHSTTAVTLTRVGS
jgi:hypothetical protein